jgi:hypothetical protein
MKEILYAWKLPTNLPGLGGRITAVAPSPIHHSYLSHSAEICVTYASYHVVGIAVRLNSMRYFAKWVERATTHTAGKLSKRIHKTVNTRLARHVGEISSVEAAANLRKIHT